MMFMNQWDIEDAVQRHANHDVLGPATRLLARFMETVNENSDGWAHWGAAPRAAKKLMMLIESGDGTLRDLKKAITPIKSCCTRHKLPMIFKVPKS